MAVITSNRIFSFRILFLSASVGVLLFACPFWIYSQKVFLFIIFSFNIFRFLWNIFGENPSFLKYFRIPFQEKKMVACFLKPMYN